MSLDAAAQVSILSKRKQRELLEKGEVKTTAKKLREAGKSKAKSNVEADPDGGQQTSKPASATRPAADEVVSGEVTITTSDAAHIEAAAHRLRGESPPDPQTSDVKTSGISDHVSVICRYLAAKAEQDPALARLYLRHIVSELSGSFEGSLDDDDDDE